MAEDLEPPDTDDAPQQPGGATGARGRRNGWESASSANGDAQVTDVLVDAAAEVVVAPPESPYDRPGSWYVVHTYAGYENKVKSNLESRISSMNMEDRIFEVVIPLEDVVELKNGKRQVVSRKVFPGYLMVRMDLDDDSWYVVRNTPGVTGFVGLGARPTPLSRREVENILVVKTEGAGAAEEDQTSPGVRSGRVRPGPRRAVRRLQRHDRRDQRGPAAAQGPGQHLRPGDAGRVRVRPGSQALTPIGASTGPGQAELTRPKASGAKPRGASMAKRQVTAIVRIQLPAGKATPAPPVGTALGPHGIQTMEFVKQYNAATEDKVGQVIPVEVTIFSDRSFSFVLKTPPTAVLIRQELGIPKGAKTTGKEVVGTLSDAQVAKIAQIKMPDLNANDLEAAKAQVAGTARSMGVRVS